MRTSLSARLLGTLCVGLLALSACTTERGESPTVADGDVSVAIDSPSEGASIRGNVVPLQLVVTGVTIVGPDVEVEGKTGHFHVFIDRDPIATGQVIPKERGIIHSTDNPVPVTGLLRGEHRLVVVLGDQAHRRIGSAEDEITVSIDGPSVVATAPAEIAAGSDLTIEVSVEGVQIVAAASDEGSRGTTGHLHAMVDPAPAPTANDDPIVRDDRNIHFADKTVKIPASLLTPGSHTIWIVLGDKAHIPFSPLVADKITVTVT